MRIRVQRFLVPDEPFYLGCWSSFAAIWNSPDPSVSRNSAYLFRNTSFRRPKSAGKSVIGSIVLHVAAVFLVLRVADTDLAMRNSTIATRVKSEVIYYPLPAIREPKPMP